MFFMVFGIDNSRYERSLAAELNSILELTAQTKHTVDSHDCQLKS